MSGILMIVNQISMMVLRVADKDKSDDDDLCIAAVEESFFFKQWLPYDEGEDDPEVNYDTFALRQ